MKQTTALKVIIIFILIKKSIIVEAIENQKLNFGTNDDIAHNEDSMIDKELKKWLDSEDTLKNINVDDLLNDKDEMDPKIDEWLNNPNKIDDLLNDENGIDFSKIDEFKNELDDVLDDDWLKDLNMKDKLYEQDFEIKREYLTNIEGISQALAEVVDEFFVKQNINFGVTTIDFKGLEEKELIDRTISKISQPIYINEIKFTDEYLKNNPKDEMFSTSELIFGFSRAIFNSKTLKIPNKDPRVFKFIKYIGDCEIVHNYLRSNLEPLLEGNLLIELDKIYSFYLCQYEGQLVKLITFEWFQSDFCDKKNIKYLNNFDIKSMTWKKPLKNYEKYKNFNQCPITTAESFWIDENEEKYTSRYGEFFHIVAEQANFTLKIVQLSEKETHFKINYGYSTEINSRIILTSPIWTHNIGLMVTKGEKYTDYEKLLMPFDFTTWCLLLGTFCTAFLLIFIINKMNKNVQKVVYGEGVTMPSLNVVSTFFGIAQTKLPKLDFARFILINFICFCLIFRTAYQGVLFDYMNSDMRKPHAQTIDEVFDNDFRILSYRSHIGLQFFRIFDGDKRQKQIDMDTLDRKLLKDICQYISDNATKTAIVTEEHFDIGIKGVCKQEIIRIKETVFTVNGGIALEPFHYLYYVVESTMQKLLQAGIVQYWYEYNAWYHFKRFNFDIPSKNKILAISDLSYGFNIWLIVCSFAIIAFFIEVFVGKFTKKNQKTTQTVDQNKEIEITEKIENSESEIKVFDLQEYEHKVIEFEESKVARSNENSKVSISNQNSNQAREIKIFEIEKDEVNENSGLINEEEKNKINYIEKKDEKINQIINNSDKIQTNNNSTSETIETSDIQNKQKIIENKAEIKKIDETELTKTEKNQETFKESSENERFVDLKTVIELKEFENHKFFDQTQKEKDICENLDKENESTEGKNTENEEKFKDIDSITEDFLG
ncbi:hypothetical protein PVAND_016305 [Polypedilum vanderplanki]|uniref:Ionotropic receptor n=1 Tax=Polypedilum vanderplanki TaxID=319348 RepID=A0A9J6BER8_POLVA|nr:hypothetical protein PVAND_016305 [Polypedilum vanderplanki]